MTVPPQIEAHGENCTITVGFGEGNYGKLSSFPAYSKWKEGTRQLIFRPVPANIKYINENWPNAVWQGAAKYHLDHFIEEQIKASALVANKERHLEDDGSYEYKHQPFNHQRQAFLLSRDEPIFAYLMEQGTGKSKLDIDGACYAYSQGKIEAWIIIAPNGVHSNWIDTEIPDHIPDWCPYKAWTYSSNLTKARKKELEDVCSSSNVLKIFAFNVEGFTSEKAQKILQRLILQFKCRVSIDESDSLKNHTSHRTSYLTKACDGVAQKRIMTGTEITKGLEDLYGQLNFLGMDILGFDTYTSFKNHFCTMGGFKNKAIVGYKNVEELIKLIGPYSYRALKDDCLDLPPKIYKRIVVELSPKQREIYNNLKNNFWAELDGKQITAPLAIVRLGMLQQITCGWFPVPGESVNERIPGDNPKLEATLQHCRSRTGKTIVWCKYKADVRDIAEELAREHGRDAVASYFGETKVGNDFRERGWVKDGFQNGGIKYLVANKAAARGLTLTSCDDNLYHSNSFDFGDRKQSEDRTHRIGTVNSVLYTDIVAKNTPDQKIINCLKRKQRIADLLREKETLFMEDEPT